MAPFRNAQASLEEFVNRQCGEENAIKALLSGSKAKHLPPGVFETIVNSNGAAITVRGLIDRDGVVKLSTAFIPD